MFINQIRSAICNHNTHNLFKAAQVGTLYPARMANLALAFLLERPYRHVEPTARPLFDSMGHYQDRFIKDLAKLVAYAKGPPAQQPEKTLLEKVVDKVTQAITPGTDPYNQPTPPTRVDLEPAIRAWLAVPETEERKAWRLGREAKARAKREARRAEFIKNAKRIVQAHEAKVA
jgi:hypothetical protein